MNYAPAEDRKGHPLQPGDKVRIKLYPKGTAEGVVAVSKHSRQVMPDGSTLPALVVEVDGRPYGMPSSKGVLKLSSTITERVAARYASMISDKLESDLKQLETKLHQYEMMMDGEQDSNTQKAFADKVNDLQDYVAMFRRDLSRMKSAKGI